MRSLSFPLSVFIDGPNIDCVLGGILGHAPKPNQRPRWDRVKNYFRRDAKLHFVLNQRNFNDKVFPFHRALRAIGYVVHVESATDVFPDNDDPVDTFILKELHTVFGAQERGEPQQVTVVSHDHCYAPVLAKVLHTDGCVKVVGFREEMSPELLALERLGGRVVDLEYDVGAFSSRLPRPSLPLYSL
jgi:putative heme uptake system protein